MAAGKQAKVLALLVVAAIVLLGLALYPRREPEETANALRPPSVVQPATGTAVGPSGATSPASAGHGPPGSEATARHTRGARPPSAEAMQRRQRVLDALAQRTASSPSAAGTAGASGTSGKREYPPGTMADKSGGELAAEVKVLNHEFIPLVDECFDQAHERNPKLGGTLALSVTIAAAEGVGGIIESVEPAPMNQLHDEELIECARQSAFGIEMPNPKGNGRKEAQLTMPYGTPPDAGVAP